MMCPSNVCIILYIQRLETLVSQSWAEKGGGIGKKGNKTKGNKQTNTLYIIHSPDFVLGIVIFAFTCMNLGLHILAEE